MVSYYITEVMILNGLLIYSIVFSFLLMRKYQEGFNFKFRILIINLNCSGFIDKNLNVAEVVNVTYLVC